MKLNQFLPETTISSSRIVQESISVGQGVSAYGALASFIDNHIAKIDLLAEYLSDEAAQRIVKSKYDSQYFDSESKYRSFLNRNIYLNKDKVREMQEDRYIYGFLTKAAIETALKFGSRIIGTWANKKDTFITCEQLYAFLVDYVNNADPKANKTRARIELNKIRNSLPLDIPERKKLASMYNSNSYCTESLDLSSVINSGNESLQNSAAYFISVLSRQLYGANTDSDRNILNYYSLIDLNGQYGKELSRENEYNYDNIAADQTAYLQISRGLMKNMFLNAPNVDLDIISQRAEELAQYDPYAVRRKKIKGAAKKGALTKCSANKEVLMILSKGCVE